MKLLLKRIVRKLHILVQNIYDKFTSSVIEASIGDILLVRNVIECNQFLCAARVLDIQLFIEGDASFEYQNAISGATYGSLHREEDGNKAFKSTIESFQVNGYNPEAGPMEVDVDLRLMNGTHRMGCCYFFGYPKVLLKVVKRQSKTMLNVDGYYLKDISSKFLSKIHQQTLMIHQNLVSQGICFCTSAKSLNTQQLKQFVDDIKALVQVEKVFYRDKEILVLFSLKAPQYIIKNKTLISQRALIVKEILSKRYNHNVEFSISNNCLEGKMLFNSWMSIPNKELPN